MKALTHTDFNFPGQKSVYHGKVRDVYNINDELMVMVATDRISAFDVILPKGNPLQRASAEPDCSHFPRCHERHRTQLEAGHSGPDGDRGTEMRRLPRGNDYPWVFDRLRMA